MNLLNAILRYQRYEKSFELELFSDSAQGNNIPFLMDGDIALLMSMSSIRDIYSLLFAGGRLHKSHIYRFAFEKRMPTKNK